MGEAKMLQTFYLKPSCRVLADLVSSRVAKCHGSRGYIHVKKWLNVKNWVILMGVKPKVFSPCKSYDILQLLSAGLKMLHFTGQNQILQYIALINIALNNIDPNLIPGKNMSFFAKHV